MCKEEKDENYRKINIRKIVSGTIILSAYHVCMHHLIIVPYKNFMSLLILSLIQNKRNNDPAIPLLRIYLEGSLIRKDT